MTGTRDNPTSPEVPYGLVGLGLGLGSLLMTVAGCVIGVQWIGVPIAVLGLVASVVGRQRLARGEAESVDIIIWSVVINTVALAVNLLLFAFCAIFIGVYLAAFVAALLAF